MPEIKNTFLAGKMNKSLDDRLLPEGEYRDALNVQITKSEGSDVGAIQNIKGNALIENTGVTLNEDYKVIGSCFDDQNNIIYWFVTDNTNHYVFKYEKSINTISTFVSGSVLNFNKNSFVQANIIENYLFFTDGINEPKKADTSKTYIDPEEYDITVAKLAPSKAPLVEVLTTESNAGNYIEEKFVRFAYRYKYSDNTYSVYSPFSNIVFSLDTNVLTEDQIQEAYSSGELAFFTNKAKTISITPRNPFGAVGLFASEWDIVQVDILMKSSDSPAVMLLDSIKVEGTEYVGAFTYNSEKPKTILPENQLTRVYDNVPRSAVAQEVVGNRVVYGNFVQDFNINTTFKLPFTVKTELKAPNNGYFDYLGIKSNRNYEVGIVFSDEYGRTSPVMFGQNNSVYLNYLVEYYSDRQLAIEFNDNLQNIKDAGFKYYSIVVKQSEQEYYNIYTSGFGYYQGKTYFSVFGDNINKIPIDTSTYNTETNINTTNTVVYSSILNQSSSDGTTPTLNPFSYSPLQKVKITGISTLNNFDNLTTIATASNGLNGIYKKDNNYLLAEIDGSFGMPLYQNSIFKYADLGILETKGFESAIDIYYETATQGLISEFDNATDQNKFLVRVNYFNCVNLQAPTRNSTQGVIWQESRIKGGFNETSMDYGVQAYITNEDYGQVNRSSSLIYSGILNNNTKVNNTNQFPSGEAITRTLDPLYGSIQKLYADTEDLLIFQEEKVSQALIDKDIIYTAEGQGLTTAGVNVISQINSYGTNYGIGTNPESFAVYAGRKYFVDKPKGAVLRLSRDGITEISNYGMRSYFRDVLSGDKTGIIGAYDIYNKEYILSIQGTSVKWQDEEIGSITLGYDESNNGWTSRYSYIPEAGGSLDGSFYTFKQGNLYMHNALKDLEQNYVYNTFYGTAYPSEVELVFNQNPSSSKNFLTINYEGTDTWNIIDITTDTDSAENIAGYDINNEDLIISSFKKYDNKYYSNLFNKTASNNNEVVFGNSISGIKGYFTKFKIKTNATDYKELFSVSTNYNINSY